MEIQAELDAALVHHRAGRLAEAEAGYRRILAERADHARTIHLLGMIEFQAGKLQPAVEMIQRAARLEPPSAGMLFDAGLVLAELHRWDEAIVNFQKSLELRPDSPATMYNLANALQAMGRLDKAIAMYRQALALRPDDADYHNNLGNALQLRKQLEPAIAEFKAALVLRPDLADAWNNLGNVMLALWRPDEAVEAYGRSLSLRPHSLASHVNLGNAYKAMARLDEALAGYDRGLAIEPNHAAASSSRLYTLHYHPRLDGPEILRQHLEWAKRFPPAPKWPANEVDATPDRRLRIGYVSPDFRSHCQIFFTLPIFSRHNHAKFEIFFYSDTLATDGLTEELRKSCEHWRNLVGLPDEQVAEMIRRDRIDILVDLTVHMARNRLPMFATRAAPVQVTWLGYPGTTGVAAMDYRLTDPFLDPPGLMDSHYSERCFRLPDTFWCYDPLATEPAVNPLPALSAGHVTFGCLNNFCKLNEPTLRIWAEAMSAAPGSRLLLLAPAGSCRDWVRETLAAGGIESGRVEFIDFMPRREYLQTYQRIDIGLDTFPYNGHTTSLDSLWMGVPVVTIIGQTAVGRAGWSQLSNLGLEMLAAEDRAGFVRIVDNLSRDLPKLAQLRATLRPWFGRSPLTDARKFAGNLEAAYRRMWEDYMNGQQASG